MRKSVKAEVYVVVFVKMEPERRVAEELAGSRRASLAKTTESTENGASVFDRSGGALVSGPLGLQVDGLASRAK